MVYQFGIHSDQYRCRLVQERTEWQCQGQRERVRIRRPSQSDGSKRQKQRGRFRAGKGQNRRAAMENYWAFGVRLYSRTQMYVKGGHSCYPCEYLSYADRSCIKCVCASMWIVIHFIAIQPQKNGIVKLSLWPGFTGERGVVTVCDLYNLWLL